jgi:hypothetical protein
VFILCLLYLLKVGTNSYDCLIGADNFKIDVIANMDYDCYYV